MSELHFLPDDPGPAVESQQAPCPPPERPNMGTSFASKAKARGTSGGTWSEHDLRDTAFVFQNAAFAKSVYSSAGLIKRLEHEGSRYIVGRSDTEPEGGGKIRCRPWKGCGSLYAVGDIAYFGTLYLLEVTVAAIAHVLPVKIYEREPRFVPFDCGDRIYYVENHPYRGELIVPEDLGLKLKACVSWAGNAGDISGVRYAENAMVEPHIIDIANARAATASHQEALLQTDNGNVSRGMPNLGPAVGWDGRSASVMGGQRTRTPLERLPV